MPITIDLVMGIFCLDDIKIQDLGSDVQRN